ncbi:NADH-quinone oxidoreductase subunit A [Arundinibacter roseus]|uniref:NADH-quinone oxidoreductase subunit A n=1 Tax=Arundinibacter roseus TaxID=2070510 RepID=A0A4R4K850_9BACT|nr:NADH-quinone oxidoreductase subunit A [Arundinibacter roseus]TDB62369.1 NADH-quinone oxidoreductase subunit A [Arundinibacter roseus]
MLTDFGILLLFILAGLGLLGLILGIGRLLRPDRPNPEKNATYESGEEPVGNANVQFNVRFYVVALLFVLFEIELIFLFPWAVVFGNEDLIQQTDGRWGWFALAEMTVFVGMLILGLAYAWVKGYLDWVRPKPAIPATESPVPAALYEAINKKYESKTVNKT